MEDLIQNPEKLLFDNESVTLDRKIKSVLFDMDGVILDSNSMKVNIFYDLLSFLPEIERESFITSFKRNFGKSRDFHFEYLQEKYLKGKECDSRFIQSLKSDYAKKVVEGYQHVGVCDGVRCLLNRLVERGARLFLITGSLQQDAVTVLKRLGLSEYFEKILGAPTSKVDHISTLLEKNKIDRSSSIMIGDSVSDIASADFHDIPTLFVEKYSLSDPYDVWSLGEKMSFSVVETLMDVKI